jgi:adenylylsulfate kinase
LKQGWCVWITGLPGSGKSTVAKLLHTKLESLSVDTQIISIDMLRQYATPTPTYTPDERTIVYGALVFTAKMLTKNGVNVIIDATANRRAFRDHARQTISRFLEVYLDCPLEICMQREATRQSSHLAPSNIYQKAKKGQTQTVPGVDVPYEQPFNPEIEVDSHKYTAKECAAEILAAVQNRFPIE